MARRDTADDSRMDQHLVGTFPEEDVEGHLRVRSAPEPSEDDVEGHLRVRSAPEPSEDDVEGHLRVRSAPEASEDDVEGHVQPPRDIDIER